MGLYSVQQDVQNAKPSLLNILGIRTLRASILFRILKIKSVKNDVFNNESLCDNVTDELKWCQVQSNTPGKGERATPVLHQITSSQLAISTQARVLRLPVNSPEKVAGLISGMEF